MSRPNIKDKKIVIVHDWLIGGGAELVVEALHGMFPSAPIYTSYCSPEWRTRLNNADIRTSYLQRLPTIRKFIPFLRAYWFSRLDLSEYDIIISSTGAEAKAAGMRSKIKNQKSNIRPIHICYMHAPTHYYWSRYEDYLRNPGWPRGFNWLGRLGLKLLVSPMRRWDFKAAQRPDHIIANSTHTQTAIREYYKRESTVIHPPVDTDFFGAEEKHPPVRSGFVITGRQTPYKRFDLAVAACTELNLPLKVVGSGPEHETLKAAAGPSVSFLGHVSRQELRELLRSSEVFIFPGEDDFGIAPVEALASGTPVIAYESGGALDYIKPGISGEFFFPQTIEALSHILNRFESSDYRQETIKSEAQQFSKTKFARNILRHVESIAKKP